MPESSSLSQPVLPQRMLRRAEAAQYARDTWGLPCATRTLAKLAVLGGGPLFRKAGRIPLYDPVDIDTWVSAKLGPKQRSTSDTSARGTA
jgi:hypothetical protein